MTSPYWATLNPVVGLICNIAIQIAWLRFSSRPSILRSIYAGFLAGMAAVFAVHAAAPGSSPAGLAADLLANLVIYGLLGYCYFHFSNLGETGRRTRLMRELYESPEGLTLEQILGRYGAEEVVARRLSRLMSSGQVVLENGRYRIGRPVMALISGILVLLKKIILGRDSEFAAAEASPRTS